MYLLNVSYTALPENVLLHSESHSAWVKKYFDNGTFLFAGPKKSKLGGAILAKSIDKKLLMKILSEDSYVKNDVVEYHITDFDCKLLSPELQYLSGC
ncbi:MAG: hypothetical protein A3E85_06065 [Gammaproteobacteria bacterium RIFCSPHIGHO2_12_FULL_45_12]|nr:MAG: hypothetical protein A3E85_06065 [Gammaproteobacteria bacterium RIFCSPHIGHO2_12_FULL_45_12]